MCIYEQTFKLCTHIHVHICAYMCIHTFYDMMRIKHSYFGKTILNKTHAQTHIQLYHIMGSENGTQPWSPNSCTHG